MSKENVEIVREVFKDFNSEDIGRIVAAVHPELEVVIPPEVSAEPDTYLGPEGIRRYFQSFQDAMDEIRFEPERLWDAGDSVVVSLRVTAKGRQTAIAVEQRSAGVWTIRDGQIIRVRSYASLAAALQAVGLRD
ncbi:MAG: Ketosteroid isomerase-related protein [Solirubrobacterales bacterium]|nr:Ketosteroid isomerase-related protein [Solirubrobacterales bacterium]